MISDEFSSRSVLDLLRLHARIIDELKGRGVLRTKNNPVGDYAEWIISNALGLTLEANSASGHDATDSEGVRYQIKARRVTPDNQSRQLSAIRKLDAEEFDYLVGVIFDADFVVTGAYQIPHEVVREYATYREHTNAHILHLRGSLLSDPRVSDITSSLT